MANNFPLGSISFLYLESVVNCSTYLVFLSLACKQSSSSGSVSQRLEVFFPHFLHLLQLFKFSGTVDFLSRFCTKLNSDGATCLLTFTILVEEYSNSIFICPDYLDFVLSFW